MKSSGAVVLCTLPRGVRDAPRRGRGERIRGSVGGAAPRSLYLHSCCRGLNAYTSSVPTRVAVYAVLVRGSNGDGAWRGLVTIVELIDPRPYKISLPISKADLHCFIC